MRRLAWVVMLAGCGRVGFDVPDADPRDDSALGDDAVRDADDDGPPMDATAEQVTVLSSGTRWLLPADWNAADNTVECIGGGGGGGTPPGTGGGGGGGGAYAKIASYDGAPLTFVDYQLGGGAGVDTDGTESWFGSSTRLRAAGGAGANGVREARAVRPRGAWASWSTRGVREQVVRPSAAGAAAGRPEGPDPALRAEGEAHSAGAAAAGAAAAVRPASRVP